MNKIKVYSKANCRNCLLLKQWLQMKEISFEIVDISQDKQAQEHLIALGKRSLPQVFIDDALIKFQSFNDILNYIYIKE